MYFKRNSWIIFLAGFGVLALCLALPLAVPSSAATGIIGGADAVYHLLLTECVDGLLLPLIALAIATVFFGGFRLIFPNAVQKHFTARTTLISLGLSAIGGVGLGCALQVFVIAAFDSQRFYPIRYPVCLAGGLACLGIFFCLITIYFTKREDKLTLGGFLLDLATSILYLPGAFLLFSWVYGVLT